MFVNTLFCKLSAPELYKYIYTQLALRYDRSLLSDFPFCIGKHFVFAMSKNIHVLPQVAVKKRVVIPFVVHVAVPTSIQEGRYVTYCTQYFGKNLKYLGV